MILVAGITASVLIQTMNTLQEQALSTGSETIRDVSGGVKVTHVSAYQNGTSITQLAIFLETIKASADIDLGQAYISLSDGSSSVVLSFNSSVFSSSVSSGLFGTINSSNLSSTKYGILVVRDVDTSCDATTTVINDGDLVVLLINTTNCFSGIGTRTEVTGSVIPEYGIKGVIEFVTPSAFVDTILDVQP